MPEIVSRVDTPEGVSAAVQNGADAVLVSLSGIMGQGLTPEEWSGAAEFCRMRGVKIYADLDREFKDEEYPDAVEAARSAWLSGADAVCAGSIGLIYALRRALPETPIHAGLHLNLHDSDGLRLAAAMGCRRVYVAPELSRDELYAIMPNAPVEVCVFAHGFVCAAYSGQCRFGSPGLCGKPCLTEYECGVRDKLPLSLKDICLASHVTELGNMGAAALLLNGCDRRPEHIAIVTGLYTRAVATGRAPSEDELNLLTEVCPAAGFTDGYYTGNKQGMTGLPGKTPDDSSPLFPAIRRGYLRREFQRVPVTFKGSLSLSEPLHLIAEDDRGNIAEGFGAKAELAFHRELTHTMLQTELYKTGGTPFLTEGVRCSIQRGITIDAQEISALRDKLLAELLEKRRPLSPRTSGHYEPDPPVKNSRELPVLTVYVEKASQLSKRLADLRPPVLYIPLEEVPTAQDALEPFLSAEGVSVCAVMPRVIYTGDRPLVASRLIQARQLGITEVLCGSPSHAIFARQMGFEVRGGLGMGVLSSHTLSALRGLRFKSVTISPELSTAEASALNKYTDCEYVIYGRTPVMHTDTCVVKNALGVCGCEGSFYLTDKSGFTLPVARSWPCRSTVYSSKKLFMARRSGEYMNAGFWGVRLMFTTEGAEECADIAERYLGLNDYDPASYTGRG